jgi:spore germination protein KC
MRKWISLLVIAVLLQTGCWSRIEVSDLGVVAGLAVDTGEQMPVRMTLYISRSPGAGPFERGQSQWVVAREGRNVADAISQIRRASARRISLHHLRMVLVSEEYARRGMDEVLDLLARHPQVRLLTRLMIVRGRAQPILEIQPTLEALQPENLAEIVSAKGGPDPRLKELLVGRAAESFSPWVYALHTVERPARMENAPEKAVELAGAALLRQDRVVAMLDQRMTQALLWLEGNPREVTLIAPCPDDGVHSLSAQVQRGEVAVYPSVVRGSLRILVAVTGTVDLVHSECLEDVVKPEDRAKLEHQLQVTLQARLERLIQILQETETDPAAFGKWVQLRQTAFWRTIPQDGWPKVWKTTPVSLDVGIILNRAGLLIDPAHRTRAELEKGR